MLLNGWHSDKTGERRWHAALAGFVGGAALLVSTAYGHNTVASLIALLAALTLACLATVGGLVALWPHGDAAPSRGAAQFTAPGVTFPHADVVEAQPPCPTQGPPGTGCGNIVVKLRSSPESGRTVGVSVPPEVSRSGLGPGDSLELVRTPSADGQPATYSFFSVDRSAPLWILAGIFVLVVALVAQLRAAGLHWKEGAHVLKNAGALAGKTFVLTGTLPNLGRDEAGATKGSWEGHEAGGSDVSGFVVDSGPGEGPDPHTHPYSETFIVLEGRGRFRFGDGYVEAQAGEIVGAVVLIIIFLLLVGPAALLWGVDSHIDDAERRRRGA